MGFISTYGTNERYGLAGTGLEAEQGSKGDANTIGIES
jgi:hypothetical protein